MKLTSIILLELKVVAPLLLEAMSFYFYNRSKSRTQIHFENHKKMVCKMSYSGSKLQGVSQSHHAFHAGSSLFLHIIFAFVQFREQLKWWKVLICGCLVLIFAKAVVKKYLAELGVWQNILHTRCLHACVPHFFKPGCSEKRGRIFMNMPHRKKCVFFSVKNELHK